MLFRHYSGGMTMDTLCFDDVRADDPSITDTSYVDVPADALPDLVGTEFWWQEVPPSSEFDICRLSNGLY